VLVIDWMTTGDVPPMKTSLTLICLVNMRISIFT